MDKADIKNRKIMTSEKRSWILTLDLRQRVQTIRKEIDNERADFEKKPQLCPIHNKLGVFVRRDGAYTRGYAVFRCPEGHEFKFG